jgi:predicted DNA-binding transcriptional regulator YafY
VPPPELRKRTPHTRIFAPIQRDQQRDDFAALMDRLHAAIVERQVLRLDYRDEAGAPITREIEPMCLSFWGAWTLGAWCRLREDFRNVRPDRIDASATCGQHFAETAARRRDASLQTVGAGKPELR